MDCGLDERNEQYSSDAYCQQYEADDVSFSVCKESVQKDIKPGYSHDYCYEE